MPPYEGPVIRGANVPADALDRYQPGRVVTEPAFTSTTILRAVAAGPAFVGNVEFRIFSTTGRDISSFSMYPDEQEIYFRPA
ncbi:ADP-ribosyltransferase domain-containing protein [Mycobacterium tilburgii]|uniref:ADP-ribosyltransferase domain-containing protein n=1 Tax=Mycobacterium tilburgii TaxID=44467 RepID=UPI00118333F1